MCLLFFLFMFVGVIAGNNLLLRSPQGAFKFDLIDEFFLSHYRRIFLVGALVWLIAFVAAPSTSYGAEDFEAFFHETNALSGIIGALSGYAIAAMALAASLNFRQYGFARGAWMYVVYAGSIVLLLGTAQRLSVISPIFTLVAALAVTGGGRQSFKIIAIGLITLAFASPFLVFLREFNAAGVSGQSKVLVVGSQFSYGNGSLFETLLRSIMQRSDLLEVFVYLKKYIDASGTASVNYFSSFLFSFVPKFIFPTKPYPLSDDGTIWGSISVIAWNLLQGDSTGSLTAFGAISAYWEGGWGWLPVNGVLTGLSFSLIFAVLGRGGAVARWMFTSIFVTVCIKNAPPSFLELWSYLAANIYTIISIAIANSLLFVIKREKSTNNS